VLHELRQLFPSEVQINSPPHGCDGDGAQLPAPSHVSEVIVCPEHEVVPHGVLDDAATQLPALPQ
jgi:hypothetical protein